LRFGNNQSSHTDEEAKAEFLEFSDMLRLLLSPALLPENQAERDRPAGFSFCSSSSSQPSPGHGE
jgi:hypothetical protein